MAYNKEIDLRIKKIVSNWKNTENKKMFGGVCHLIDGKMFCGVNNDNLILRLGAENAETALGLAHVEPFDITGKPMKGWVMIGKDGTGSDDDLKEWLGKAREFVNTLSSK